MINFLQTLVNRLNREHMTMKNEDATSLIVIPDNHSTVNTEAYQEFRNRERGQFNTENLQAFVSYIEDKGTADKVFIDNSNYANLSAKAIFNIYNDDLKEVGQADDTAILKSPLKPEFAYLVNFCDELQSQDDVIDFLIDHKERLSFKLNDETLEFTEVMEAFRNITVKSEGKTTSEREAFLIGKTTMEKIEVEGKKSIPDTIIMQTSVYENLNKIDVPVRVSTKVVNERIWIMFKITSSDDVYNERAEAFKDLLIGELSDAGQNKLYIGNYSK